MKIYHHRLGSNQYKKVKKSYLLESLVAFSLTFYVGCVLVAGKPVHATADDLFLDSLTFENQVAVSINSEVNIAGTSAEIIVPLTVDEMVDKYADKYGKTQSYKNRTKALLHFLLYREAGYGSNKNCGDSGLACGPLQFHEPTYQGYRKIMIKEGHVDHVGSRLNMEDAIETCAWAVNDGREEAWGPYMRGEIKL